MKINQILHNYPFTSDTTENFLLLAAFVTLAKRDRHMLTGSKVTDAMRQERRDRYVEMVELLESFRDTLPQGWEEPSITWGLGLDKPSVYLDLDGNSVALPAMREYKVLYDEMLSDRNIATKEQETAEVFEALGSGVSYLIKAVGIGLAVLLALLLFAVAISGQ